MKKNRDPSPVRRQVATFISTEISPQTQAALWLSDPEQVKWLERTMKNSQVFGRSTVTHKLLMWCRNFAYNFDKIRTGLNMAELHRAGEGIPAIVVGAGPSVERHNQLEKLRDWSGILIVCDRILIHALEAGLVPTMVLSTDGDPVISKFYAHPLCRQHAGRISAGLNAQTISPLTVKACPFPIYWFLTALDDPRTLGSISQILHYITGDKLVIQSSGNVGALGWHVAHFLGCDPIGLVGLDYGYLPETPLTKTIYWNAFLRAAKQGGLKARKRHRWARGCFKLYEVPWSGLKVRSDLMWDTYKSYLMPFIQAATVNTVNLSPQSFLFGGKLNGMDLAEFITRHDPGKGSPPSIIPDIADFEEFLTSIIMECISNWPLRLPVSPITPEMMDPTHLFDTQALLAIGYQLDPAPKHSERRSLKKTQPLTALRARANVKT